MVVVVVVVSFALRRVLVLMVASIDCAETYSDGDCSDEGG